MRILKNKAVRCELLMNDMTAQKFCEATGRNNGAFSIQLSNEMLPEDQEKLIKEIREVASEQKARIDRNAV